MPTIAENIAQVRQKIVELAHKYQRDPASIGLLAVSKTHSSQCLAQALAAGQLHFGENYLQEARDKQQQLASLPLQWHFIGPIQSNKTRDIASHFAWVHTVERLKIAERLSAQRPAELPPLNLCLQVNISGEVSKSGCTPDELLHLAQAVEKLDNLRLRGLMVIPRPSEDLSEQRAAFRQARQLMEQTNAALSQPMDTLSMGMSGDLEAAIAEGATWVRIGTAIFGTRG